MAVNVLFTTVGRRVELMRLFRKAFDALGLSGRIVATDMDPMAPAVQVVDRYYRVPRIGSPDYIPTLLRIVERESISRLFPLIDTNIPVLASHREQFIAAGCQPAVVAPEAARIAGDKAVTQEFFSRLGLRVPRNWPLDGAPPNREDYPLFIKPRDGSAAVRTFRVENPEELAFFQRYVPNPIVQQLLQGPEITNDVVCDVDGTLLGVVSRERIHVRGGEVVIGKTIYDSQIDQACRQIAAALPALGPITVQCMRHQGEIYFTEINARMGGGLPLAVAAGADIPRWLLARAAGRHETCGGAHGYRPNIYMTRFDDSFFLTQESLDDAASRNI